MADVALKVSVGATEKTVVIKDAWIDPILAYYGGYDAEVINPDHDPEDPESLAMIPNPESKVEFFLRSMVACTFKDWKAFHRVTSGKEAEAQGELDFEDNVTVS